MSTPSQIAANQANAQLSTGPRTEPGKAASSLNALKTGLTGRTILLPSDDVDAYTQHVERLTRELQPEPGAEQALVQAIADTEWRLLRIPTIESGILILGRRQLAVQFADETDRAVRCALIDAQVFLTYKRELGSLALQETRLRRQREKDLAELHALRSRRIEAAASARANALTLFRAAQKNNTAPFNPALFGFEFSLAEIESWIALENAQNFVTGAPSSFGKSDYQNFLARSPYAQAA
jgi:hypothetical protein